MTTTDHRLPKLDQFTVWTALDNHEPTREYMRGQIEVFQSNDRLSDKIYVLTVSIPFMDTVRLRPGDIYLLDNGEEVIPLYTSGYQFERCEIFLRPFPTATINEPDNKPTGLSLGPRKSFHLKVYE